MKKRFLLLALFLFPSIAEATTWYAGSGGSDSNNCSAAQTQATRKLTIAAGLACMAAAGGGGHTLVIQAGTYTEIGLVVPSGTAGAHNTVRSDTTGTVTFTGLGSFNLNTSNVTYVDFVGNRTTLNMVWDGSSLGSGNYSAFSICQVSVASSAGCTGENHDITFDGVRMHDWGYTIVYLYSANNTFKYSRFDTSGMFISSGNSGYGFYLSSGANNNVIEFSEIDHMGGYGVHIYAGYAAAATNNTIRNNRIHNNGLQTASSNSAFSIMLGGGGGGGGSPSGANNQAYNNVIYNERDGGIAVSYNCTNCIVYNNTIYDDNASGIGIQINSATGTLVTNNISSNSGGIVNTGANTTFTQNLCSSAGTNCALSEPSSTTFITPGSDFHIKAGSAAINAGANLGAPYNVDVAGVPRPAAGPWEIGAYEYGIVLPPVSQLVLALPLDEGTGAIAVDVSGQKNNGNFVGGVAWDNSGKYGKAVMLDGTGYLNIPAANSLALTSAMTLEAWIYPTVDLSNWVAAIRHEAYYLYAATGAGTCPSPALAPFGGYSSSAGVNSICATSSPPINQWSHVAVTFDGSTLTFYLNGNPVSSRTSSEPMVSGSANLSVGASTTGTVSDHFIGKIDQPMVYNYARTPAQINGDMNTPLIGAPGKLVEIAAPVSVEISAASSIEISAD